MAYLMNRNRTIAPRTLGETLAIDPFRSIFAGLGGFAGVDVTRTEQGGYRVEIPVAGFTPDQVEITLDDRVLTVSGKNERRDFTRSLVVPDEIDCEKIGASVEHGLLTLTMTLHDKALPRKIAVNVSSN